MELAEGKKEGSFEHKDQLSNVEMASDNSSGGFSSWAKSISCLVKELRDLGRAQATQGMQWQIKLPGNGGEKHRTGGLVLYRNGTKKCPKEQEWNGILGIPRRPQSSGKAERRKQSLKRQMSQILPKASNGHIPWHC